MNIGLEGLLLIEQTDDPLIYFFFRADIADNLHNIMETQWKKTLEILTSPSRLSNSNLLKSQENLSEIEQLNFTDGASNFNRLQKNSNNLSKSEENLKTDLLRCYIEKVITFLFWISMK